MVSSCPNSGSTLHSLSSTLVSPLGCYSWRRGWTGTFESQSFITSFTWRGSASIQRPRELHRTVLLRIWSCLSRSAASPIICVLISYLFLNSWISHSASSLEDLTVTSSPWTEGLIHRASAIQALSQQPTLPTAWSSSVSFRKLDVDSAPRLRIEVRSSHVNHQEHCPLLAAGRCLRDDDLHSLQR